MNARQRSTRVWYPLVLVVVATVAIACTAPAVDSADAESDRGDSAGDVASDLGRSADTDAQTNDVDDGDVAADLSDVAADLSDGAGDVDTTLPSMSVLFVGNSYTAANDLPKTVRELALATGTDLDVEVIATGGAKLCDHRNSQSTGERMASGDHDVVVIQGQSVDMFYDGESAYHCGEDLGSDARDAGASVVWFATWARREGHEFYSRGRGVTTPEEMTDWVEGWYGDLSRGGTGGHVARVGHGWELAYASVDGAGLHAADGSHPSEAGTLTAACTLAQALIGERPELPTSVPFGLSGELAEGLCEAATREPCLDELSFCDGSCQSVAFDAEHCGACDAACDAQQVCWHGECGCAPGYQLPTSLSELSPLDPTCEAGAERIGRACSMAAHELCKSQPCADSGFGPHMSEDGDLVVTCTPADVVATTYTELATHHPSCDGVIERRGDACTTAAHRACIARGASAGYGPVWNGAGDDVEIACLEDANVHFMSNVAVDAWGCTGYPGREWDDACDRIPHGRCEEYGYGGYGPIEPATRSGGVEIVCLSRF